MPIVSGEHKHATKKNCIRIGYIKILYYLLEIYVLILVYFTRLQVEPKTANTE